MILIRISDNLFLKVRDKEEELVNSLTKIDNLRQDIRKAEKLRRELEVKNIPISCWMFPMNSLLPSSVRPSNYA